MNNKYDKDKVMKAMQMMDHYLSELIATLNPSGNELLTIYATTSYMILSTVIHEGDLKSLSDATTTLMRSIIEGADALKEEWGSKLKDKR